MLARNSILRNEKTERRGAPKNKYWPRGDMRAHSEKQVKINEVAKNAVGIIDGLIRMTVSNRGPRPRPGCTKNKYINSKY